MAKNNGKVFEDNFKKSVPSFALLYRLPDTAQSFNATAGVRFTRKNPFDYILWDSIRRRLFALELKTVADTSISFERVKEESRVIHKHQIDGLKSWAQYDGITAGFIIEFRKLSKTIFLEISEFCRLTEMIEKHSFNTSDLDTYQIKYHVIGQKLRKVHFAYDVEQFLNEFNTEEMKQ